MILTIKIYILLNKKPLNTAAFQHYMRQRLLNILAQSDDYFSDDLKRRVIDNCVTGIIIKNCYNFIINDENNDQVKKAAELVSEFIYKAVH